MAMDFSYRGMCTAGTAAIFTLVLSVNACGYVTADAQSHDTAVSYIFGAMPVAEPCAPLAFEAREREIPQPAALAPRSAAARNWPLSYRAVALRRI